MKIPVCTLKRGSAEVVLHGTIHVASDGFFEEMQQKMNEITAKGYRVFYEEIKVTEEDIINIKEKGGRFSENEQMVCNYLVSVPEFYSSFGLATQGGKITYPEGSINIDITFTELVRRLVIVGFHKKKNVKAFSQISSGEKADNSIDKPKKSELNMKELLEIMEIFEKFKFLFNFLFRKERKVLIHCRNKVAIEKFETLKQRKNVVYYGRDHIEGMIKLLKENGWKVVNLEEIDLSKYK